ncbi:DUF1828 domain-containing protein [Pseudomonas guariconensis]|uniref:DUF1828 domain-containing protein n=1 Tax=Pseudomonas guariconensis TaxID=1288410 RepID=UPI0018D87078|nr:DUF1828 domain-containing protein [Pseudomonas guariconensis]MBH3360476.1 DUF1828 domain-containing protein [Pseudomonas guariconensis]
MNCADISRQLGFQCRHISDGLTYIQSPLTLAFDGAAIGAFVQDIGRGLVRITDNSDILFTAMTHGIAPDQRRSRKFGELAKLSGMSLSENGELHTVCHRDEAGFQIARFIEAASRIGDACGDMLVIHVPKFQRKVGSILARRYKESLRRDFVLSGASGHQLTFPFVINIGSPNQMVIQTIAAGPTGKPNWASIYGAVGKMGDLKNSHDRTKRTIILERGEEQSTQQAMVALAESASIVVYDGNNQHLYDALQAA